MKQSKNVAQLETYFSSLLKSKFIDVEYMVDDILDVFETFSWACSDSLPDNVQDRFKKLVAKGNAFELSNDELIELLEVCPVDHPYSDYLQAKKLLEVSEDANIEAEKEMIGWEVMESSYISKEEQTNYPEHYQKRYHAQVTVGNQISIDIKDEQNEPSIGMMIEISCGTPAIHIDLDGGDNVIHIHKACDGLVVTPETNVTIEECEPGSSDNYTDGRSKVFKP